MAKLRMGGGGGGCGGGLTNSKGGRNQGVPGVLFPGKF